MQLFDLFWPEVIKRFESQMVPKYKEVLIGNCEEIEGVKESPVADDEEFWEPMEKLFTDVMSQPDVVIVRQVHFIFSNCYYPV